MALPTNDHHVHSDGYRSDRGEPDEERMLMELADEIEQIPGVTAVWPEQNRIEVEYDGDHSTYVDIECVADEWGCAVPDVATEWLEVRHQ